jgi:hypothetical protein
MLAGSIPAECISIWYLIEKCVWTTGNSGLILHEIRLHTEVHQMNNGPYRGLSNVVYFNMVNNH